MPIIILETHIKAPVEQCFDAARDIGLHCRTARRTRERVIGSVRSGLLGKNESVTFEGVHIGRRRRLTSKITEFNRPTMFVDVMQQGPFKSLKHTHEFKPTDNGTLMVDMIEWVSPRGVLGVAADKLFLLKYMRSFLSERNEALKSAIEKGHVYGGRETMAAGLTAQST